MKEATIDNSSLVHFTEKHRVAVVLIFFALVLGLSLLLVHLRGVVPQCQGPGYMGHLGPCRATYVGHPRARYMGQARVTNGPLEYAANKCHNVPKRRGTIWQKGEWR